MLARAEQLKRGWNFSCGARRRRGVVYPLSACEDRSQFDS